MRRTPAFRTALLALLGGLAAFQLVGLITELVSASRGRVTGVAMSWVRFESSQFLDRQKLED